MFYKLCPLKKRFKRTKMSRQPCLGFIDNCQKDCSMVCFHDFVSCTIPMCPSGWKKTKNKKKIPPQIAL